MHGQCGLAVAQVPNVSRQEFSVLDISEDGFVSPSILLTPILLATVSCAACINVILGTVVVL
jgi:hypothetical protein